MNFEQNLLLNKYIYDFVHENNEINLCNENNTLQIRKTYKGLDVNNE